MAEAGVSACVGLCLGGGCAAQVGFLIWQLWAEPQDKRSRRLRKAKRQVAVTDDEVSSGEFSDEVLEHVDAKTSKKTASSKLSKKTASSQKTEKQPSKVSQRSSSPRSPRSPRTEQPLTTTDLSRKLSLQTANREDIDFQQAGWQGFSMEEARNLADAASAESMSKTPGEVLSDLQRGNTRFWMGTAHRPERSAFERRALLTKQFPTVAVLSCSDSRVPIEIVFDVGLGDMFVVRVAGNCLDNASLASLQYAVHHLKVKVLVIMGHEGCGAVKAAGLPAEDIDREPESLGHLLRTLGQGLDSERLSNIHDKRAHDREAVVSNVSTQVGHITEDAGIMAKIRSKELIAIGAFYELSSGIVDFFDEVSAELPSKGRHAFATYNVAPGAAKGDMNNGSRPRTVPNVSQIPVRQSSGIQRRASGQEAGVKTFIEHWNGKTNLAIGG